MLYFVVPTWLHVLTIITTIIQITNELQKSILYMNIENNQITVAMLTYNRVKIAITSLKNIVVDPCVKKVWVLDDGSDSYNFLILSKFCASNTKIEVLRKGRNMGHDYNFMKSANLLRNCSTDFVMLCESDMLFAKGWGKAAIEAFSLSPKTVCITPMLHRDQFSKNRSKVFRARCIRGVYETNEDGVFVEVKKPFGTCYTEYPDHQRPKRVGKFMLKYVSNSICTMIFRTEFFNKLPLTEMKHYEGKRCYLGIGQQDAWLCWACFEYNNYNPKSLAVLDPGIALTFGGEGLHGPMICNNLRWMGSWWWRYRWTSALTRMYYSIRYKLTYRNIRRFFVILLSKISNFLTGNYLSKIGR